MNFNPKESLPKSSPEKTPKDSCFVTTIGIECESVQTKIN